MGIAYKASDSPYLNEEPLSTGLPELDWAIGIGGIPRKRITEIYGHKSSGKTTLGLKLIQTAQVNGFTCVYADAENALDFKRAKELGVNLDELIVLHGDYGEEYLDEIEKLIREGKHALIVVDSVDALQPRKLLEATSDDTSAGSLVGRQAKMMGGFLRRIIVPLRKKSVALVLLNQIRTSVMGQAFEYTPGGRALEFYTSVRIKLNQSAGIKEGEKITGIKIKARITKNKIAPPFNEMETSLMFDTTGFSATADLLDTALRAGVLTRKGPSIFHGERRLAVGAAKTRKFLEGNPDVAEQIRAEITK